MSNQTTPTGKIVSNRDTFVKKLNNTPPLSPREQVKVIQPFIEKKERATKKEERKAEVLAKKEQLKADKLAEKEQLKLHKTAEKEKIKAYKAAATLKAKEEKVKQKMVDKEKAKEEKAALKLAKQEKAKQEKAAAALKAKQEKAALKLEEKEKLKQEKENAKKEKKEIQQKIASLTRTHKNDDKFLIPFEIISTVATLHEEGNRMNTMFWTTDEHFQNGPIYNTIKDEDCDPSTGTIIGYLHNKVPTFINTPNFWEAPQEEQFRYDENDDNLIHVADGFSSVYSGMLYKTIEEYRNECKERKYYTPV